MPNICNIHRWSPFNHDFALRYLKLNSSKYCNSLFRTHQLSCVFLILYDSNNASFRMDNNEFCNQ